MNVKQYAGRPDEQDERIDTLKPIEKINQ
ncbi:hypothetical protein FORC88_1697 [Salmonella enterica subsp. enterica serovar Typhimurium]|nr:hypothetical protein FORC88_1697 [Salmonella enterica subsp. enterica serovar Typhimurium]